MSACVVGWMDGCVCTYVSVCIQCETRARRRVQETSFSSLECFFSVFFSDMIFLCHEQARLGGRVTASRQAGRHRDDGVDC